jgi:hypothetical protein
MMQPQYRDARPLDDSRDSSAARADHGLFAIIEFTGITKQYDVRQMMIEAAPDALIVEIDPLAVPENARWNNADRAQEICKTISSFRPSRVVIVSYCTGASFACKVASLLTANGTEVVGNAALDPALVSKETIIDAVQEIGSSLGRNVAPDWYDQVNMDCNELCRISFLEKTLRLWTRDYAVNSMGEQTEFGDLIDELAERYISWLAFLCSAAWSTDGFCYPLTVFASAERTATTSDSSMHGTGELHIYATEGQPCVASEECQAAFRHWCHSVMSK